MSKHFEHPEKLTSSKYRKYLHILFVFILTSFIASTFSLIGVDPHHDGVLFKPAMDVANGRMLFRDTFTQYGALTVLLQSLAIKLFGEFLIVIKLLTAFFYALISVLLWLIWSRLLPYWLTTLSCVIWLLLAPYYELTFQAWSSVYALFFLLFSAYCTVIYIEENKHWLLIIAGSSAALAFWCRQPVGIFLLTALIFTTFTIKFAQKHEYKYVLRAVALVMLGFILVCMGFFVWLTLNSAVIDWYLQSIKFAYIWGNKHGGQYNLINIMKSLFAFDLLSDSNNYIWTILPIAGLIAFIKLVIIFIKKKSFTKFEITLYSFLIISFSSWLQYYPITCIRHTYWAAGPLVGVIIYLIWSQLSNINHIYRFIILTLAILLIFHNDVGQRLIAGYTKLNEKYVSINIPKALKWVKLSESDADYYRSIGVIIENYSIKYPDRTVIMVYNYDVLFLTFTSNMINFHQLYVPYKIIYESIYPDYTNKRDDFIRNKKPLIIGNDINVAGYRQIAAYPNYYTNGLLVLEPVD